MPPQGGGKVVSAQWQGPLPPPAALEQYNDIVPGGADRIVRMAEQEVEHRIKTEQAIVKGELAAGQRGQYLGAAVAFLALLLAALLAYLGSPWPIVAALVSVPVLGMVNAIVNGRRNDANGEK